jgi:hypothetical protein
VPEAVVKVERSRLVKQDDELQRVATRVPLDLRDELKVEAAIRRMPVNLVYQTILREFLELAPFKRDNYLWKTPKTAPRKDRHGEQRGDSDWMQVLIMIPRKLLNKVDKECAAQSVSLATFTYTAFDWYASVQKERLAVSQRLKRANG